MKKQLFVLFAIAILLLMAGYSGYVPSISHEVKKERSFTGAVTAISDKYIELKRKVNARTEIASFIIDKDTDIKDKIVVGQSVTVVYYYEKKGSKYKKIAAEVYPASKIE